MFRKWFREFYLLSRWEQRAWLLLSLLLLFSLGIRLMVRLLPARDPPGLEQFLEESAAIRLAMAEADSLEKWFTVDLNSIDSAGLLPLPGIGPVFAGRIVRYRELLGGFLYKEQLTEVYGLTGETVSAIAPRLLIDSTNIRRLRINSADFRTLLRHPYLEYEDVLAIVRYRDAMGQISSLKEIRQNALLPDSVVKRVRGYLDLSDAMDPGNGAGREPGATRGQVP